MVKTAKLASWAGIILIAVVSGRARGKTMIWKPVPQALLKENNKPVKNWNVYQPDKNRNLVLVQVDRKWFVFNLKQKRVYRVEHSDFETRGDFLAGPEPDRQTIIVKTTGWDSHDVGPAQEISMRITDGGDVLTIELPHPLAVY